MLYTTYHIYVVINNIDVYPYPFVKHLVELLADEFIYINSMAMVLVYSVLHAQPFPTTNSSMTHEYSNTVVVTVYKCTATAS